MAASGRNGESNTMEWELATDSIDHYNVTKVLRSQLKISLIQMDRSQYSNKFHPLCYPEPNGYMTVLVSGRIHILWVYMDEDVNAGSFRFDGCLRTQYTVS